MLADGSYSVAGLMTVDAFAERLGVTFDALHSATIAGYVFGELGHVPKVGDSISIGEYRLAVETMDHLRIARLRVERIEKVVADLQENRVRTRGNR